MELYLCRHGETEWSLTGRHTGRTNLPLTERGKEEAVLLGKRLKNIHFDAVFSSPMERAIQTCRLAHFDPTIDPDLSEWDYGDYEGLSRNEIEKEEPGWNLFDRGALRGESTEQVGMRADRFLKKIVVKQGRLLLFSHGHFSRVIAARWLKLDPGSARYFSLHVASLSILGFERDQPTITLWNETKFLKRKIL